jgi:hypothetical protein
VVDDGAARFGALSVLPRAGARTLKLEFDANVEVFLRGTGGLAHCSLGLGRLRAGVPRPSRARRTLTSAAATGGVLWANGVAARPQTPRPRPPRPDRSSPILDAVL